MIPNKIKKEIENSPLIAHVTGIPATGQNWKDFTRTVFERIAKRINQEVTQRVIENPSLVHEFLMFGENEFENIKFKYGFSNMDDFVELLKSLNHQRPYIWISGKTLQCYWNNSNAKEKKLNVLLTFLGIKLENWDEWKNFETAKNPSANQPPKNDNGTLYLLKKHFVGHYYRYYQKTDGSPVLVKTPFVIKEHQEEIVKVETKTLGHQYKSSYMVIRDGALYIECENLDWNEKEIYIFNIGFETNPKVLTGVSNTLNRKGQAIAIKNILVKQTRPFDYKSTVGIEIPYDAPVDPESEDGKIRHFFKHSMGNIISTSYCHSLEELSEYSNRQPANFL